MSAAVQPKIIVYPAPRRNRWRGLITAVELLAQRLPLCSGELNWHRRPKRRNQEILKDLRFPIDTANILRKRHSLKKELLKQTNLVPTRIAILGGSTTAEVKSMLELFLLAQGIQPTFYESGYNRYCEDVLFENPDLWNFKPDIVFIHTTWHNVSQFPDLMEAEGGG